MPNKDLQDQDWSKEVPYNSEFSFNKIFKIIPVKDLKRLELYWILPGGPEFDTKKSDHYLTCVLCHEGPNSLTSYLIKLGLIKSLTAGINSILSENGF